VSDTALHSNHLGPYELLSELGSGGMGSVWRARRADGLMERDVAIKLIALGMRTMSMRERFARERQILATLNHPNIARLYEAGVTDSGQPYLVLELVEGEPIDQYCARLQLPVAARVRLFMQVLAAVSHAHQRLVVHRDLKPGNILVTADGTVKLLDFGISKLLHDHELSEEHGAVNVTRDMGRILTPEYASPEQLSGGTLTTSADVYSAGVLLFQLLCGAQPYRVENAQPASLMRAIVEHEPLTASSTVRTRVKTRRFVPTPQMPTATVPLTEAQNRAPSIDIEIETRARERATTPTRLGAALAGDLDNILGKALKKDPYERYETAAEFADDLRAYLELRPVKARPDSVGYRTAKFVRRNRGAVATGALSLFAILAGIAATTWQAFEARKQATIAQQEALKANAMRDYVVGMFRAVGRDAKEFPKRGNTTARELIDHASGRLHTEFGDQPEVKAFMRSTLTSLYYDLDHTPKALSEAQTWFAESSQRLGADHPQTIDAMIQTGLVLARMNRSTDAAKTFADAKSRLPTEARSEQWLRLHMAQALLHSSEYRTAEAQKHIDEAKSEVARYPKVRGEFDYVDGQLAFQSGRYRYGLEKLASALGEFRQTDGESGVRVADVRWRLGIVHLYRNDWAAAEGELQRALEVLQSRSPDGHRDTLVVRRDLAFAKMKLGKIEDSFKLADQVLADARVRAQLDGNASFLAGALQTWGRIHHGAGDIEPAHLAYSEAAELMKQGQNDAFFSAVMASDLLQTHGLRGDEARAKELAVKVVQSYEKGQARTTAGLATVFVNAANAIKKTDPALATTWLERSRTADWSEMAFPSTLVRSHLVASEIAARGGDATLAQRELGLARAILERHRNQPEADLRFAEGDILSATFFGTQSGVCSRLDAAIAVAARFTVAQSPLLARAKEAKNACARA
jgi:eukaryotic-like serine/threonine-protein kinase